MSTDNSDTALPADTAKKLESALDSAQKQIDAAALFNENTLADTLISTQKNININITTLSQFANLDPRVFPLMYKLNECNARINGLLGRMCVAKVIDPRHIDFSNGRKLGLD